MALSLISQTYIRLPSSTLLTVERVITESRSVISCGESCMRAKNPACFTWRYSSVTRTCEVSSTSAVAETSSPLQEGPVVYQVSSTTEYGKLLSNIRSLRYILLFVKSI